ncbi:PEP-CTERM sorting domain-containing protein [Duganella sp. sic0402]|uniref:PEP-CTERM sorting domain-containing protein n=1 Tax=Duganella sp. sic0402 TaxID=2854786 RepID=UPI001C48BE7C|nr:PEP-CTERM sorting domain-containing protein [Duganella sp. sic0402]MBV7534441.1 PEP-CTERM sorting domain-containing protein [Duganella sp. sic0402]
MTKKVHFTQSLRTLAGATLLLLATGAAHAAAVSESGDAGELINSAQTFSGNSAISSITGSLLSTSQSDYADLFRVYLYAGSIFRATTTASVWNTNNFDTALFLFDASGHGVVANDDDPNVGPQSTITITQSVGASGYYYLAIAGAGYTPVSAGGSIFGDLIGKDQVQAVGVGGSGALSAWQSTSGEGDRYQIVLQGAYASATAVPEPVSITMLMAGLGLVGAAARRRRAQA